MVRMLNKLRRSLAFACLAVLCIAGAAKAEGPSTFSERVQNGNKVEAAPEYSDYFTNHYFPSLGQPMSDAIKHCASIHQASSAKFAVVSDLSANGEFEKIEFQPQSNVAWCFSEMLKTLHAPPPPSVPGEGFPVVFEITITP